MGQAQSPNIVGVIGGFILGVMLGEFLMTGPKKRVARHVTARWEKGYRGGLLGKNIGMFLGFFFGGIVVVMPVWCAVMMYSDWKLGFLEMVVIGAAGRVGVGISLMGMVLGEVWIGARKTAKRQEHWE